MSRGFKIVLVVFFVVTLICVVVQFLTRDTSFRDDSLNNNKITNNLDGVVIKNEKLVNHDGKLNISLKIINKKDDIELESIELKIVNSKGEIVSYILLPINSKLEKSDSIVLNANDTINYKKDDLKIIYSFSGRR